MTSLIKVLDMKDIKRRKSDLLVLRKELDNNKKLVPNKNWFYEKIVELS